jgi:hypothetical protein
MQLKNYNITQRGHLYCYILTKAYATAIVVI